MYIYEIDSQSSVLINQGVLISERFHCIEYWGSFPGHSVSKENKPGMSSPQN